LAQKCYNQLEDGGTQYFIEVINSMKQPEFSNFSEEPSSNFAEESLQELAIRKKGYGEKIETGKSQEIPPGQPYPPFNDEAFLVYQDDLRKKAAKSKKGLMHVTQEQAIKDNEDFDKRRGQEFQENQKKLEVVKEAMDIKLDLLKQGKIEEAQKIKIVLLLLGGGLKVSQSMAQTEALTEMGYRPVFDGIYGISTGTMAAGAFAGSPEQAKKIAALFFGKQLSPEFINWGRPSRIVNINYVRRLIEKGGEGAYDLKGIQENPARLFFQLTDVATGKAVALDMQGHINKGKDPAEIAEMSMSLPGFSGKSPTLDGRKVTDGGLVPIPIDEIKKLFDPTHILILPQYPYKESSTGLIDKAGKALVLAVSKRLPIFGKGLLAKGVAKLNQEQEAARAYIQNSEIPIAFLYPPEAGLTTLNKKANAKRAMHQTAEDTFRVFGHLELVKDYRLGT